MEKIEIKYAKGRKKNFLKKNYAKENSLCSNANIDWSKIVKLIEWREDFL